MILNTITKIYKACPYPKKSTSMPASFFQVISRVQEALESAEVLYPYLQETHIHVLENAPQVLIILESSPDSISLKIPKVFLPCPSISFYLVNISFKCKQSNILTISRVRLPYNCKSNLENIIQSYVRMKIHIFEHLLFQNN